VALTGKEDETTFNDKVRLIIREFLAVHPGSTKDRVYDEVVSRMVRSGTMEAHDFDGLLRQTADETLTEAAESRNITGRWYLKDTELAVTDSAETAMEDKAADKIEAFMKEYLQKHQGDEGVHYSDLFERYVYAAKDKPRRQLADFLPDYFFKTEKGTWRPAATEEEARAKAEGRTKGTGRKVRRYLALLEQGAAIPQKEQPNDATLAEWIRHCKRTGLYEQGRQLYEKGGLNLDNLSDEVMVNVEEDYQVCMRMFTRQKGTKQKRGAK